MSYTGCKGNKTVKPNRQISKLADDPPWWHSSENASKFGLQPSRPQRDRLAASSAPYGFPLVQGYWEDGYNKNVSQNNQNLLPHRILDIWKLKVSSATQCTAGNLNTFKSCDRLELRQDFNRLLWKVNQCCAMLQCFLLPAFSLYTGTLSNELTSWCSNWFYIHLSVHQSFQIRAKLSFSNFSKLISILVLLPTQSIKFL